jgi:hypothetical protein
MKRFGSWIGLFVGFCALMYSGRAGYMYAADITHYSCGPWLTACQTWDSLTLHLAFTIVPAIGFAYWFDRIIFGAQSDVERQFDELDRLAPHD